MRFKDFQAPVLFSSIFKALNLGETNSSTFKDVWEPCVKRSLCEVVKTTRTYIKAKCWSLINWLQHRLSAQHHSDN